MEKSSAELWEALVQGLLVARPFIETLEINPVPRCAALSSAPEHSSECIVVITVGPREPGDADVLRLRMLGWTWDYPYLELRCPQTCQPLDLEMALKARDRDCQERLALLPGAVPGNSAT